MKRFLVVVVLALVGALGVTVVLPPVVANAASIPVPGPVNVLPSVVTGAESLGAMGQAQAYFYAKMFKAFSVGVPEVAAIQSVLGSTATPAQTATVGTIATKFKMPAVKVGGLIKGAGVLGVALMADQILVGIGHGVTESFGIDVEGNVCGAGNAVLAMISQVDCTEWDKAASFVPNLDAVAMPDGYTQNVNMDTGSTNARTHAISWGEPTISGTGLSVVLTLLKNNTVQAYGWNSFFGTHYLLCQKTSDDSFTISGLGSPNGSTSNTPGMTVTLSGDCGAGWLPVGIALSYAAAIAGTPNSTSSYGPQSRVIWGKPGTSWYKPAETLNPDRLLRCQITLSNSSVLTADTASFKESDGQFPAANCPNEFPAELSVTNVTIWEIGGGQTHELYNQNTTPEYQHVAADFPECVSGSCLLDLKPATTSVSCFQDPVPCSDWFASPTKTSDFLCTYGTHSVSLSECSVYAPTFKPDATTSGAPYGDPTTGEALPGSGPDVQNAPLVEEGSPCFPSGWGVFNPLEWIYRPIQCAWQWAIVPPRADVDEALADTKSKFDNSPPGKIGAALLGVLPGLELPSGCSGVTVDLTWLRRGAFTNAGFPASFNMLSACAGDVFQPWAIFCSLVISAGLVVVSFRTIPALVGRVFGYGGVGG